MIQEDAMTSRGTTLADRTGVCRGGAEHAICERTMRSAAHFNAVRAGTVDWDAVPWGVDAAEGLRLIGGPAGAAPEDVTAWRFRDGERADSLPFGPLERKARPELGRWTDPADGTVVVVVDDRPIGELERAVRRREQERRAS